MKLEINVFGNEKEALARGYMEGQSFYENGKVSAIRYKDSAHIETTTETFLYDENHTEGGSIIVDVSNVCCNLKTLAICELIKAMTYDYCLPETIVIKKSGNKL